MLIVIACTEGNVSEPAYIEALKAQLGGQAPRGSVSQVEILPIPLGGNHGHKVLINKATREVDAAANNPESILSIVEDADDVTLEKWLICDYDDMDKHGINIERLRELAKSEGFVLIVSKPKFEVFILLHFLNADEIAKIHPSQYNATINKEVEKLNRLNMSTKEGMSDILFIPKYGKKKYHAPIFFGKMLSLNPELIDNVLKHNPDYESVCFSEMPHLIKRLQTIFAEPV